MLGRAKMRRTDEFCGRPGPLHREALRAGEFDKKKEKRMLIVAGYLRVVEAERDGFVNGSRVVVEQARRADGCLDFALSADLVEPDRVLVFERWDDRAAVEAFRGSGPGDEQLEVIEEFVVNEYDVVTSAPPQELSL